MMGWAQLLFSEKALSKPLHPRGSNEDHYTHIGEKIGIDL